MSQEWKNYAEKLFHDERTNLDDSVIESTSIEGPEILESEVIYAVKCMNNRKAPRVDEIPAEVIRCLDARILTKILNKIYDSGEIPKDWLKSTFVPIPKKTNAKSCSEFRLISLMSHMLKIFLRVVHGRIYKKCEEFSGK